MLIIRDKLGTTERERYTPFGWTPISKRRFTKAVSSRRMMYFAAQDENPKRLKELLGAEIGQQHIPVVAVEKTKPRRHGGYSREDYERDLAKFEQMEMALSAEILKAEQAKVPLTPNVIFGVQTEIDAMRRKAKARLLIGRMRAIDKEWRRKHEMPTM